MIRRIGRSGLIGWNTSGFGRSAIGPCSGSGKPQRLGCGGVNGVLTSFKETVESERQGGVLTRGDKTPLTLQFGGDASRECALLAGYSQMGFFPRLGHRGEPANHGRGRSLSGEPISALARGDQ